MTAYYNEIDPFAAQWLRELIAAGLIAPGDVDERSIEDVRPDDLVGYTQCHFFAGIGVWSYALRRAGVADDTPVWTGSCPCFPAGTLVLTSRGYVSIESVQVGDKVLTHKGRWRSVQAIGSDEADMVRVKGQGHWGMLTTESHPFLTGKDEWTAAGSLAGKRWRTVAAVPSSPIPPIENTRGVMLERGRWRATGWKDGRTVYMGRFKSHDEAAQCRDQALANGRINVRGADGADVAALGFARFLGYWLGDGWTSGDTVFLCGARSDAPLLNEILIGAGLTCSPSIERTSARARCGSKSLVRWLGEHFGATASGKRVPTWVHGAPSDWRREFLRGYQEADGHREPGVERFTTVSRAIAVGVRILLNQDGRSASITWHRTKSDAIQGRKVSTAGGFYRVTAYDRSRSFSFSDLHGIGYVRTVEPAGRGRVFNIAVEEDESYTADGIVVHNCQPFSSAGKRGGFDDERHLWPAFHWLIQQCAPPVVLGEQVASKSTGPWFDLVQADVEALGYAFGCVPFPAAGVSAPHLRDRAYWAANAGGSGLQERIGERRIQRETVGSCERQAAISGGDLGGLADTKRQRVRGEGYRATGEAPAGMQGEDGERQRFRPEHRASGAFVAQSRSAAPSDGFWRDADWLLCRDGKLRPVEPGTFPLVDGLARGMVPSSRQGMAIDANKTAEARVMRLRGYGNAINAVAAELFIRSVLGVLT